MRARTIRDCERDVKGIHQFELIGALGPKYAFWCSECGAIGYGDHSSVKENREHGLSGFKVVSRVQE
jgi:hypothetical protein